MRFNWWHKFMYPHGSRRTLMPWRWAWRDRILVLGELFAVGAAIAAIPIELSGWNSASWFVIGATILGTSALLWYAFDLISIGELPLANQTAHKIRQVVDAMAMENEGATFDWENIDVRGGIPTDLTNWSRLRPELKEIMDCYGIPIQVAVQILAAQDENRQIDSGRQHP